MDRQIYNNLPPYARLADEKGILEHICETIQPEYDIMARIVEQQPFRFDVSIAPEESLRWLGQIVTLAGAEDHWLGLGINPAWSTQQTRNAIARIWKYLQIKGTEAGIREAIAIWLMWEDALNPEKLKIILPFGKTPTNSPPKHWGWDIPYGYHLLQSWDEKKQFGGINTTHYSYYPNWFFIQNPTWGWEYYQDWHDRTLVQIIPGEDTFGAPYLGAEQPWMHFRLTEESWNRIVPDVFILNYEIWSALAEPTVNAWYEPAIADDKGIQFPLIEIEQQKKFITVTELEIDGHQWFESYAISTEKFQQIIETTSEQSEFQFYPGASWEDLYAGLGKDLVSKGGEKIVLESVLIEGVYPGASWEDLYSGKEVVESTEVLDRQENGNFLLEKDWSISFIYGEEWWYLEPKDIFIRIPVASESSGFGATIYYSPTYYSVIEIVKIENPVYSPITPGVPYFASLQEFIKTTQTIIDTGENICTLGKEAHITHDGTISQATRFVEDPTLFLEFVKGSTSEVVNTSKAEGIYPGFRWYQIYPTNSRRILSENLINLMELDISNIQSLSIDNLTPFIAGELPVYNEEFSKDIYSVGFDVIDISNYYYSPYVETKTVNIIETPDRWQIKYPTAIATWLDEYGSGKFYIFNGKEEIIEVVDRVSENEIVKLCNIFDFSTTRTITKWNEYQIPIELSEEVGRRIEDLYPSVKDVLDSQNWHLIIETKEELVGLSPTTVFLETNSGRNRTVFLSQNTNPKKLALEFVYKSNVATEIMSVSLLIENKLMFFNNFDVPLSLPKRLICTFGFKVPLSFEIPVLNKV